MELILENLNMSTISDVKRKLENELIILLNSQENVDDHDVKVAKVIYTLNFINGYLGYHAEF